MRKLFCLFAIAISMVVTVRPAGAVAFPMGIGAVSTPYETGSWEVRGPVVTPCVAPPGCGDIVIHPIFRMRFGTDLVPQNWVDTVVHPTDGRYRLFIPGDAVDFRFEVTQEQCFAYLGCDTAFVRYPPCPNNSDNCYQPTGRVL